MRGEREMKSSSRFVTLTLVFLLLYSYFFSLLSFQETYYRWDGAYTTTNTHTHNLSEQKGTTREREPASGKKTLVRGSICPAATTPTRNFQPSNTKRESRQARISYIIYFLSAKSLLYSFIYNINTNTWRSSVNVRPSSSCARPWNYTLPLLFFFFSMK